MPRFYFHFCQADRRVVDLKGTELDNLNAAGDEAVRMARELWAAAILQGRNLGAGYLEIISQDGTGTLTIPLDRALPTALKASLR